MKCLALVLFSILLVTGQTLFKKASQTISLDSGASLTSGHLIWAFASNVWIWLALVLYGVSTLLWVLILTKTPLSVAYPFVALGFIFVPLASWWLFNETIRLPYAFGVLLILAGIGTIVWSSDM